MTNNVMGAAGVGVIAVIYILDALTLPMGTMRSPNMGFVPLIIGGLLFACCVLLVAIDRLSPGMVEEIVIFSEDDEDEPEGESTGYKKPGILAGALLLYPIAFTTLGFVISTFLLLYLALRVLEYKTWQISLLTAALAILTTYVIFSVLLGVYFPAGILEWR